MKITRIRSEVTTVKALLTGAEAEANRDGESLAGAEHLLLAAFDLPDGTARRAFERLGASPERYREAIGTVHADALRGVGIATGDLPAGAGSARPPTGPMRTKASAQEAFQAAVKLAKASKPNRLLGAHVVIAVTRMEHGTAARALAALGLDRAALAGAAREEIDALR